MKVLIIEDLPSATPMPKRLAAVVQAFQRSPLYSSSSSFLSVLVSLDTTRS